jgi:broad specificity phosphatase PhoE
MIKIILVRHGQTAWNVGAGGGERFRGLTDVPLNDDGLAQAQSLAEWLAHEPITAAYSSPLQRAYKTAEIITEPHGLPIHVLEDLTSLDYGDWQERPVAEVAKTDPELFRLWVEEPHRFRFPGGEGLDDLRDRAMPTLQNALARHTDGETILVVTHQVVTRTLICAMLGLSNAHYWRIGQDTCCLNAFEYEDGVFTAVQINDTCHLGSQLRRGKGTRLLLVRHGQTAWNVGASNGEHFRGRIDLPLNEVGLAQAQTIADRLAHEPIAAIYSSPLQRALQTAQPIAERLGLPVQPHPGLLDINYGAWQGHSPAEVAELWPKLHRQWREEPERLHLPDGESFDIVRERALAAVRDICARHPNETVLLVAHQVVNKVLVCAMLGLSNAHYWRVRQDNACLDVFTYRDGVFTAVHVNDTCHLHRDTPM